MDKQWDEADRMQAIMPRWLLIVLALMAFVVLTLGLISVFVQPDRLLKFESPMGRFALAVMIAFYFSIFMSIIYVQKVRIPVPWLDKTVVLGGPPALVLMVVWLLLEIMPNVQPSGRFYRAEHPSVGPPLEVHLAQLHTSDPKVHPYLVKDFSSERLTGIYVDFGGQTGQHTITLRVPGIPRPPITISVEPGYGEASFDATLPGVIE